MSSILEKFIDMPNDDWDYFFGNSLDNPFNNIEIKIFDPFIKNYFGNSDKREMVGEFIKEVLSKSTKNKQAIGQAQIQSSNDDLFKPERAIHTISVFFLGILIWKKTKLKTLIFDDENDLSAPLLEGFPDDIDLSAPLREGFSEDIVLSAPVPDDFSDETDLSAPVDFLLVHQLIFC